MTGGAETCYLDTPFCGFCLVSGPDRQSKPGVHVARSALWGVGRAGKKEYTRMIVSVDSLTVVHDINSQGGILVDGRKKKIQIVKGDTQVKPTTAKRVAENRKGGKLSNPTSITTKLNPQMAVTSTARPT